MAKETAKKSTAQRKGAANGTRTVRSNSSVNSVDTDKKNVKKPGVDRKDLKKEKNSEKRTHAPSETWNVTMPYVLTAVGVLVALLYIIIFIGKIANGVGDAGAVGDFINNLLQWTLGWAAYGIPAGLCIMAFRWRGISAKGKTHGGLWTQFVVLLVLFSAIFELLFGAHELTWDAYGSALRIFDAEASVLPGGFVGGVIALVMRWALRQVFSAIVLIAVTVLLLMFFIGLTPDVIFRYMKERHEHGREKRAAYLREVEEARRAEAEAAEAERKADEAAKKEEERLRKEEEATRKMRERAEEARLAREEEERAAREEAERAAREEAERAAREETERAAREEAERAAREEAERAAREEAERTAAEEAAAESASEEETEAEEDTYADEEEMEDGDAGRRSIATDLDYALDERSAKEPKTVLEGDAELIGYYGRKKTAKMPVAAAMNAEAVESADDVTAEDAEDAEDAEKPAVGLPEGALAPESGEPEYVYPPTSLLAAGKAAADISLFMDEIEAKKQELADVLTSFGIRFRKIDFSRGPTITRYEIQPEPGQRVKAIQNLLDDIALSMAVTGVRFEPSIPGKVAVGIEVPNTTRETVTLRSLVESEQFISEKSKLTACLGADITGKPVVFDVAKMPHLLVAGATGMGKSVCINSIIVSLMYKAKVEELRLVLIDPKKVEFAMYRDMPHLLTPIITDPQKAAGALCSAVGEMEYRFELIESVGARDISGYKKITAGDPDKPRMCHIVIIIDELADLMMTASNDVDTAICRLAQKARAAGIHLIIGTQRPSTDVITGTIKANIPSRIACTVASQIDSRTILDAQGAEKLCGRGDMLFAPVGASRPRRVQGSFVSEEEVIDVVNFMIHNNGTALYDVKFMENINIEAERCATSKKASAENAMVASCDEDPKLNEAIVLAIESGKLSTSLMQRKLEVGYSRAAKIIDRMEELGIIGPADGNKPRQVLVTMEEYRRRFASEDDGGEE